MAGPHVQTRCNGDHHDRGAGAKLRADTWGSKHSHIYISHAARHQTNRGGRSFSTKVVPI